MRNPTSWESAIEYGRKMYWRGFRHSLLWLCAALLLFFGAGYSVAQAEVLSLGNIYIDARVIASDRGEPRVKIDTNYVLDTSTKGWSILTPVRSLRIDDSPQNAYARIAVGYRIEWSAKWSTPIELSHESSIATSSDRGYNKIELGVTWRPFAK